MKSKYVTLIAILLLMAPSLLAVLPAAGGPGLERGDARLLAGEAGAGAPSSMPSKLYLQIQEFDPLVETVRLPDVLLTPRVDGLYLLQFIGPVRPEWLEDVKDLGGELISYIPENAFIARLPRSARLAVVDLPTVRWVGPYHPGFRVLPELWQAADPVLGLAVIAAGDSMRTAERFLELGGTLEAVDPNVVQGWLPTVQLLSLARSDRVQWIQPILEPELFNDHAARLVSSRQRDDGDFDPDTRRLWSWNDVTETFNGTTGKGYIVSVADTGLDDDHPSFIGHLPTKNYQGGSTTQDTYGHGTHCSGTAAGTGVPYPSDSHLPKGKYAGVSPEATIFMQDIFEGVSIYRNFAELGKDASAAGAIVNSNSWGQGLGGRYGAYETIYDTATIDAEPGKPDNQVITFCFSAGNSGGGGDGTISSPAAAKNIITVGATGNDKGSSGNDVVGFSSRGPCADGRVKPDVVAPGDNVASAAAWPHSMPFRPPADGGTSWTLASGTSMSCPATAGAVAQVHAYVNNVWGYTEEPSPALVKALLINGADNLLEDPVYPGTRGGWGRVNLTRLVEQEDRYCTFFYDEETPLRFGGAKETQQYIFGIKTNGAFTVTLVWSDYPGAGSSSKVLVSDLDLIVTAPNGDVYKGNNFNNLGRSLSGKSLTNDSVNNVEKVHVPMPQVGFWSVEVKVRNTPQGAQRFALVATGDLSDKWQELAPVNVTLSNLDPDEGETVYFEGEIQNLGTDVVDRDVDYKVYLIDNETAAVTMFEEGNLPRLHPKESYGFRHPWVASRGDWEFVVDIDTRMLFDEFSEENNLFRIPTFVKGYGLAAELLPAQLVVKPGRQSILQLNVLNKGNVPDTYDIEVEGIPVGWDGIIERPDILLDVERIGQVTLTVLPPLSAKADEQYIITVTATSRGNSTYSQRMEARAKVGHVYGLRAELIKEHKSLLPGAMGTHVVRVTNTGNGMDTFGLSMLGLPPSWEASFSEDSITLEDNVTKNVDVSIKAPPKALVNTRADILITVASSEGKFVQLEARTRVRQIYGVDLDVTSEEVIMPGGKIYYSVLVTNLGNGIDVFTYQEVLPKGWRTTFPHDPNNEIILDAYEPFELKNLEISCPASAIAGEYDLTFSVGTKDDLAERSVTVKVQEVYSLTSLLLSGASAMYPGNETTYVVEVYNLGNVQTDFGIELRGAPPEWNPTYGTQTATIRPNQKAEFTVTISPPMTARSGFQDLSYVITYGDGNERVEAINLYLLELPKEVTGPSGDEGELPLLWLAVAVVVIIIVVAIALGATRRRGGTDLERLIAGEEELPEPVERPLPPPPGAAREAPPPPPPPPPGPPATLEELLSDTEVMRREGDQMDQYSRDAAYASGEMFSREFEPVYVGECQFCGGDVLEHASGSMMCTKCGTEYTDG